MFKVLLACQVLCEEPLFLQSRAFLLWLTHHVPRLDLAGTTEGRRATDPKQSLEQANERFNLEKLGKCSLREQ